jgi:hypothetical protein
MLCDDELYRPHIEGLRDVLEPRVFAVAEATMADAALTVLGQAPPHFMLVEGTSYGASLAPEVVVRGTSHVVDRHGFCESMQWLSCHDAGRGHRLRVRENADD